MNTKQKIMSEKNKGGDRKWTQGSHNLNHCTINVHAFIRDKLHI